MEYAGLDSEVVLLCQLNQIEIWSKEAYQELWDNDQDDDFASLAEEVMGGEDFDFDDED